MPQQPALERRDEKKTPQHTSSWATLNSRNTRHDHSEGTDCPMDNRENAPTRKSQVLPPQKPIVQPRQRKKRRHKPLTRTATRGVRCQAMSQALASSLFERARVRGWPESIETWELEAWWSPEGDRSVRMILECARVQHQTVRPPPPVPALLTGQVACPAGRLPVGPSQTEPRPRPTLCGQALRGG